MFLNFAFRIIFSVFQKNWVSGYSWSTLLWYQCYYPHWSRDALSPVCGIFHTLFSFKRMTADLTILPLFFNLILLYSRTISRRLFFDTTVFITLIFFCLSVMSCSLSIKNFIWSFICWRMCFNSSTSICSPIISFFHVFLLQQHQPVSCSFIIGMSVFATISIMSDFIYRLGYLKQPLLTYDC